MNLSGASHELFKHMIWMLFVMAAFVLLSLAALGLLDSASARIAVVFRSAWDRLK